ncbi:MAG: hypothetical protein M1838_004556, partial [Thelocarpon superellum]
MKAASLVAALAVLSSSGCVAAGSRFTLTVTKIANVSGGAADPIVVRAFTNASIQAVEGSFGVNITKGTTVCQQQSVWNCSQHYKAVFELQGGNLSM